MMNIILCEKWLSTEYLRTNVVALLFWSDWHTRALGCPFCEEYGEAMLSRLGIRLKEVGIAQSVQQTTHIFLTPPPPTSRREKMPGCPDAKFCGQVHKARALVHSEHIKCLVPHCCCRRE